MTECVVGTMTAANDEVLGSCGILLPNTQGTYYVSSFCGRGRPEFAASVEPMLSADSDLPTA